MSSVLEQLDRLSPDRQKQNVDNSLSACKSLETYMLKWAIGMLYSAYERGIPQYKAACRIDHTVAKIGASAYPLVAIGNRPEVDLCSQFRDVNYAILHIETVIFVHVVG